MPIRARKDITVYKELRRCTIRKLYYTPYRGVYVSLNSTLEAKEKDILLPKRTSYYICLLGRGIIEEGFIHCYTDIMNAAYRLPGDYGSVIVECTIKKGTLYYKSCANKEICAKSVQLHDIVAYRDLHGNIRFNRSTTV